MIKKFRTTESGEFCSQGMGVLSFAKDLLPFLFIGVLSCGAFYFSLIYTDTPLNVDQISQTERIITVSNVSQASRQPVKLIGSNQIHLTTTNLWFNSNNSNRNTRALTLLKENFERCLN
ncbi:MAG: hypothetical protein ACK5NT_06245 [Pyrinomonadaceae bacterium]